MSIDFIIYETETGRVVKNAHMPTFAAMEKNHTPDESWMVSGVRAKHRTHYVDISVVPPVLVEREVPLE